jgi:hypothetical protein
MQCNAVEYTYKRAYAILDLLVWGVLFRCTGTPKYTWRYTFLQLPHRISFPAFASQAKKRNITWAGFRMLQLQPPTSVPYKWILEEIIISAYDIYWGTKGNILLLLSLLGRICWIH